MILNLIEIWGEFGVFEPDTGDFKQELLFRHLWPYPEPCSGANNKAFLIDLAHAHGWTVQVFK